MDTGIGSFQGAAPIPIWMYIIAFVVVVALIVFIIGFIKEYWRKPREGVTVATFIIMGISGLMIYVSLLAKLHSIIHNYSSDTGSGWFVIPWLIFGLSLLVNRLVSPTNIR